MGLPPMITVATVVQSTAGTEYGVESRGRGMTKCLAQPKDLMFFENTRASVVGSLFVGGVIDIVAGTAGGF